MERHTHAYKSQWYILNLSMWFWEWTCMSVTSVSLYKFTELNSMIPKQTSYVWEKCLNSLSFPAKHIKFYTQNFALHPDKTWELLSTKLNLNLVYSFIFFLLDFTQKIWELSKGNFCWFPWCLSKITCQLHMCKQEQPILQSRYRSIDPSNNLSPIRGL